VGLLEDEGLLDGVLVDLVDDVVRAPPGDGVVRRVQVALAPRVRDLLDQNDDVHRPDLRASGVRAGARLLR
jgi:hypothetical protein